MTYIKIFNFICMIYDIKFYYLKNCILLFKINGLDGSTCLIIQVECELKFSQPVYTNQSVYLMGQV